MKLKNIILISIFTLACVFSAFAQSKLGHANIEMVLANMPETKSMQQSLQTYQKQLAKQLESKQLYAQEKYKTYVAKVEAYEAAQASKTEAELKAMEDELKAMETELRKLDEEIKQETAKAEQKLAKKQADLMAPITEKLEAKIKEVATEKGYDYILNMVDGAGVSIVLYGPDERNVTKEIMVKLGIKVPEEAGK